MSVEPTGEIKDHYVNQAAGFDCKGTPYDVVGWLEGSVITFSVRWANATKSCGSLTSWTGYTIDDKHIWTYWELIEDGKMHSYDFLTGHDEFTKEP